MLVHRRVIADTHLYTWVERGTVSVKCLSQEHNTMSLARARTLTTQSGDERTNHEATAPPTKRIYVYRENSSDSRDIQWYNHSQALHNYYMYLRSFPLSQEVNCHKGQGSEYHNCTQHGHNDNGCSSTATMIR